MRVVPCAIGLALLLAGCGSESSLDQKSITLAFPADNPQQYQDAADAQCKPYNKAAKFKDVEKRGDNDVAVYECS